MPAEIKTDVAIIGAGPVGLFAVFECGMLRMKSVVIDALEAIGGQCTALYPEKPIFDIPAHPQIAGADLIAQLEAQAAPFAPQYLFGRRVETLRQEAGALDGERKLLLDLRIERKALSAVQLAVGRHRPTKLFDLLVVDEGLALGANGALEGRRRRRGELRHA